LKLRCRQLSGFRQKAHSLCTFGAPVRRYTCNQAPYGPSRRLRRRSGWHQQRSTYPESSRGESERDRVVFGSPLRNPHLTPG